jgi:DNA topoisomerase-1
MRTDSITLSETAVTAARAQVRELYGADYLPDKPRTYTSKVKNAQEAHEAIRPAGEYFRTPRESGLVGDELRLYELIWMRTVASQMRDAEGRSVTVRVAADASTGQACEFTASGRVIVFHGFLRAYVEDADDPTKDRDDRETVLPDVHGGDAVTAMSVRADGHETKPPARYTEATLVRELEEREIGRPSTYASIIGTILARGYVYKKGTALVPSWLAFAVVRLLERHFTRLVDYDFTARMEDVLDDIASGQRDSTAELAEFYFGSDQLEGVHQLVSELGEIDARVLSTFELGDGIVARVGRYGPYVESPDGTRANVPEDLPPEELTLDVARELLANPAGHEKLLGEHPETGHPLVARNGRYGPYVTELLPDGDDSKPRTGSLLTGMTIDSVTLDDAVRLLALPRSLGTAPGSDEDIVVMNGRYGPYLKQGNETRSLSSEDQLFTITLDEAVGLLQQPKSRGRQAAAAPLRELGEDPTSKQPITVRNGRFGPYVTDGEYNATLRQGDTAETVSLDRAVELLAERRSRGPAKKSAAKRSATRKATTKKAAKKPAASAPRAAKKASKQTAKKSTAHMSTTTKAADPATPDGRPNPADR